jgi:hypothetical protein
LSCSRENVNVSIVILTLMTLAPVLMLFTPLFSHEFSLFLLVMIYELLSVILIITDNITLMLSAILLGLTFFPAQMTGIISGYSYSLPNRIVNISIIGYMCLISGVQMLIFNKSKSRKETNESLKKNSNIIFLTAFFIVVLLGMRFIINGSDMLSNKILDNYILPFVLFYIISTLTSEQADTLFNVLYVFIFINACICIVEYFIGHSLFFHDYYMVNISWYKSIYDSTQWGIPFRSTSFLGHPLNNGSFFVVAICILGESPKSKLNFAKMLQYAMLFAAMIAVNSRGALLGSCLYLLYREIRGGKAVRGIMSICALIGTFGLIASSNWFQDLFVRDSSGSSLRQRFLALSSILKIPMVTWLFGGGFNKSAAILNSTVGSGNNFEIGPILMMSEIGLISFSFFIGLIIYVICFSKKVSNNSNSFKSRVTIFLFLIINFSTYNSIGDSAIMNYLMWFVLGSIFVCGKQPEKAIQMPLLTRRNYEY